MKKIKLILSIFILVGLILFVALSNPKRTAASNNYSMYPDVADNFWAFWYIEAAGQKGIVGNFIDGTYRPTMEVSRDSAAAYLARALGITQCCNDWSGTPCTACGVTFSDVYSDNWAYSYIEALARARVINGYSDGTFRPSEKITQGDFVSWLTVALGKAPVIPSGYSPAYNASAILQRAQMAALISYNFKLNPTLNGLTYKVALDENNQPVETEDPLPAAVVRIWYKYGTTNPDLVLVSGDDGSYSTELDIQKVTPDIVITTIDPEENYPPVTLRQNPPVGSGLRSFEKGIGIKTANALFGKYWKTTNQKKSDCSKNLYDRMLVAADGEVNRWNSLYNNFLKKESATLAWADTSKAVRIIYTGGPKNFCCTGFVTFVATRSGLTDKNNRSFFYTAKTTLSAGDRRIVGAKTLRDWFIANNGKKFLAMDGNRYIVRFYPKKAIIADVSKLKPGMIYMKLPPQGAHDSGHSAIFYPAINGVTNANTMNCDGPYIDPLDPLVSQAIRDLNDTHSVFFGAGGFDCQ